MLSMKTQYAFKALIYLSEHVSDGPVLISDISKKKNIPLHVAVEPLEGGLSVPSYVKCEDIRSISTARLIQKRGALSPTTREVVEDRVRFLLGL